MIFKLSFKEIRKNKAYTFFNLIQLILVLFLIILLVSSLQSTLKYYMPMRNILTSKGFMANLLFNDEGEVILNDQLYSFSDKIDKVYSNGREFFEIKNSTGKSEDSEFLNAITIDKAIINAHKPLMKSGQWLSDITLSDNKNEIYAVITKNKLGYTTGSVINTTYPDKNNVTFTDKTENPITIKIVGEIEDGENLFYQSNTAVAGEEKLTTDFETISAQFYPYNSADEDEPFLIIIKNELDDKNYQTWTSGTSFITFDNDTTKEELSEAKEKIAEYGQVYSLETVNRKSLREAKDQAFTIVPMIISILIFLAISSICLTAINTKKQLRSYGILYICGSRWKQCALISVCTTLLTTLIAVILTGALIFTAIHFELLRGTVITIGKWQILSCCAVLLFNFIISLIMPFTIIGRTSPREIVKNNE